MRAIVLRVLVAVLLLTLVAQSADAQRRSRRRPGAAVASGPQYGPHLGYNFDADALVLGAQVAWPITPRLDLYPTFDYYFVDPGSRWALNLDVRVRPPTRYGAWYLGGGLNFLDSDAGSDTNVNLLTGFEGRRQRTRPYVEVKLILGENNALQLVGGFSWR